MSDLRTPPAGDHSLPGTVGVEHHAPGLAVVGMRGEHDLDTAPALSRALEQASAHSNVLVDLSECDFIDSTVISIFIGTALKLQAHGEQLVAVIPGESRQIARVAHMTRLSEFLPVYDSRRDAIASLERRSPSASPDPKP